MALSDQHLLLLVIVDLDRVYSIVCVIKICKLTLLNEQL